MILQSDFRHCHVYASCFFTAITALTLLVGWQEEHLACKKLSGGSVSMAICLRRCADLHMAQLMPLPLAVSCLSKIQLVLVPADPGNPGQCPEGCKMCVCMLQLVLFLQVSFPALL